MVFFELNNIFLNPYRTDEDSLYIYTVYIHTGMPHKRNLRILVLSTLELA